MPFGLDLSLDKRLTGRRRRCRDLGQRGQRVGSPGSIVMVVVGSTQWAAQGSVGGGFVDDTAIGGLSAVKTVDVVEFFGTG